jgi:predicted nucleic acid-binding protein
MIPASAQRIVLDTNVCLDLFVFHDKRWDLLLQALEAGEVQALTRADCRDEYRTVLHYPHLPLDEASRQQAEERFDSLVTVLAPDRKTLQAGLFRIMLPEAWIKAQAASPVQ